MGQRINDLNSLPSIPLDGNFALDTTTRTGKVSASDLKDFILEDVPFKFGVDGQGNYGYIKDGADTVTPFKSQADIDAAYQEGVESITSNPSKLTLDGTNGSNVSVTPGYYNRVDNTAVYDAGAASITSDPQKLTLDGTNGANVDITDGYYGTVDTTAVYAAGAASITSNPQKLTLTSTSGANVDITDGYYGTVDTTALYDAAYAAGQAAAPQPTPTKLVLGSTNGTDVDITDGYYGTVDTTAVYSAGAASITSNPQTLTLGTTSGSSVDITDGYYGTVDTTALYAAAYAAGQAAGGAPATPTKLTLGATNGTNVSITEGCYNAVDTTALIAPIASALTTQGVTTSSTSSTSAVATNIATLATGKYTEGHDAGFWECADEVEARPNGIFQHNHQSAYAPDRTFTFTKRRANRHVSRLIFLMNSGASGTATAPPTATIASISDPDNATTATLQRITHQEQVSDVDSSYKAFSSISIYRLTVSYTGPLREYDGNDPSTYVAINITTSYASTNHSGISTYFAVDVTPHSLWKIQDETQESYWTG